MRYWRPYYSTPCTLRRAQTQRDNIALIPASELDSLARWEAAARQLAPGGVLVVAQANNLRLQTVAHRLDQVLRQRGHRARLVTVSKQLPSAT